ncbi:argonaute-like protein [Moniliophthora roreri MCA 2997]|uniref:Argonaute-like protein n=1 Tax=Moniliophthora roreri (strain MCA 2997) TaxID=1381753 RepID=V2X7G4_MONRO|nr:argonaute-like protein [Moniliophthora roreri MCA 2997]
MAKGKKRQGKQKASEEASSTSNRAGQSSSTQLPVSTPQPAAASVSSSTPTESPAAAGPTSPPARRSAWGAAASRPVALVGNVSVSKTGSQPQSLTAPTTTPVTAAPAPTTNTRQPASHVVPLGGFKRTKPGTGGRLIKVKVNFTPVNIEVDRQVRQDPRIRLDIRKGDALYHQYDDITPSLKPAASWVLIDRLQLGEGPESIFDERAIRSKKNRVAYDGKKILFAPRPLLLGENNSKSFNMPLHTAQAGQPAPRLYTVKLTKTAEVNPETLKRLIQGQQSSDESVLSAMTALNIIIRMKSMSDCRKAIAEQKIFSQGRFFFSERGKASLGPGYEVWRGYFQSIRPGIGRMYLNVDTSAAVVYTPGPLISLCLQFLGTRDPNSLTIEGITRTGWIRLQEFLRGVKVAITPATPGRPTRTAVITSLTTRGAAAETFVPRGQTNSMTIAQYFLAAANVALRYSNIVCIEVGQGDSISKIPMEKCSIPPGCFMRKEIPEKIQRDFIKFASQRPDERLANIQQCLALQGTLDHRDSEYLNAFDIEVDSDAMPITINARVLKPPSLQYSSAGKQTVVTPKSGAWNMLDAKFWKGGMITHWVMVIYASTAQFTTKDVNDAVNTLMNECKKLGIAVQDPKPLIKYCNGQGDVGNDLQKIGSEAGNQKGTTPNLILVVIPAGGGTIYKQVKFFGDVRVGVATQCVKSPTCKGANSQYWANVCLKINPKLGGINFIPHSSSLTFSAISDPRTSTVIMGADVMHPAPGPAMKTMPSYSSVVASMDSFVARYMALLRVQRRQEIISDLDQMAKKLLMYHLEYKTKIEGKSREQAEPKRLIFYRDGVSEGEYQQVLEKEIPLLKQACVDLKIYPKITFIVVGKRHHARFFPNDKRDADRSGNCPAGTVIDTEICHPTEDDFYLQSHAGILGTSRSAHYTRIYDENNFDVNFVQDLSFLLCHLHARSTRSVSLPAPVYYADLVCTRAQNHYDPLAPPKPDPQSDDPIKPYRDAFKETNALQLKRMYFMVGLISCVACEAADK